VRNKRHTILVIDDEQAVRENVAQFLRLEGHIVNEAENGASGIASALRSPPDLVLCDLMMPGIDGFGVLARLRAEPTTADVPFVILTASAVASDSTVGFKLGASEYITKPFSLAVLGEVVTQRLAIGRGT
jgi:two-component system, OmpR family, alkaline phosphatase synthesis response regulator PhoP